MRAQRSGTIINLVSGAGKRAGAIPGVAYSSSKAGQASLTELINSEERAFNILGPAPSSPGRWILRSSTSAP